MTTSATINAIGTIDRELQTNASWQTQNLLLTGSLVVLTGTGAVLAETNGSDAGAVILAFAALAVGVLGLRRNDTLITDASSLYDSKGRALNNMTLNAADNLLRNLITACDPETTHEELDLLNGEMAADLTLGHLSAFADLPNSAAHSNHGTAHGLYNFTIAALSQGAKYGYVDSFRQPMPDYMAVLHPDTHDAIENIGARNLVLPDRTREMLQRLLPQQPHVRHSGRK